MLDSRLLLYIVAAALAGASVLFRRDTSSANRFVQDSTRLHSLHAMMNPKGDFASAVFCYGSLRPDDDSGMPWTEAAVEGMRAQPATVAGAKLYMDTYASLVFNEDNNSDDRVVGWVLTAGSDLFQAKMAQFDRIEGYIPDGSGLYQRAVADITLGDPSKSIGGAPIGSQGTVLKSYVYHRPDCDKKHRITSGDWLKRGRVGD